MINKLENLKTMCSDKIKLEIDNVISLCVEGNIRAAYEQFYNICDKLWIENTGHDREYEPISLKEEEEWLKISDEFVESELLDVYYKINDELINEVNKLRHNILACSCDYKLKFSVEDVARSIDKQGFSFGKDAFEKAEFIVNNIPPVLKINVDEMVGEIPLSDVKIPLFHPKKGFDYVSVNQICNTYNVQICVILIAIARINAGLDDDLSYIQYLF